MWFIDWTFALVAVAGHAVLAFWVLGRDWGRRPIACVFMAFGGLLCILIWYVLKATEIWADDGTWRLDWGFVRRMSDPSHWAFYFVVILLLAAWHLGHEINRDLGRQIAGIGAISVIIVGVLYTIVSAADGHTFFYASGYGSVKKWVQAVEGTTNVTMIFGGVVAGLHWINLLLHYREKAQRADGVDRFKFLAFIPGAGVAIITVFWVVMHLIYRIAFYAVTDAPGIDQEKKGPNPNVLVFQMLSLVVVIMLAVLATWSLNRAMNKRIEQNSSVPHENGVPLTFQNPIPRKTLGRRKKQSKKKKKKKNTKK